jgi:hypothetical protein
MNGFFGIIWGDLEHYGTTSTTTLLLLLRRLLLIILLILLATSMRLLHVAYTDTTSYAHAQVLSENGSD